MRGGAGGIEGYVGRVGCGKVPGGWGRRETWDASEVTEVGVDRRASAMEWNLRRTRRCQDG